MLFNMFNLTGAHRISFIILLKMIFNRIIPFGIYFDLENKIYSIYVCSLELITKFIGCNNIEQLVKENVRYMLRL